jgi:hypothetical protein
MTGPAIQNISKYLQNQSYFFGTITDLLGKQYVDPTGSPIDSHRNPVTIEPWQ